MKISLPPAPVRVSLPAPPSSTSAPDLPVRVSFSCVPVKLAPVEEVLVIFQALPEVTVGWEKIKPSNCD